MNGQREKQVDPEYDGWREWIPPHPRWDTVLELVPSHVFLFDTALICRYAAPRGGAFLGLPRDRLVGRHATEILPPAANGLRPIVERAAREAVSWSTAAYRYRHRVGDGETIYIWAVQVEPLPFDRQRGVLVTLYDVLDLVEERDQLRLDKSALEAELAQAHARERQRSRELRAYGAQLRTLLTAVWGYLQLLVRRPGVLGGRPAQATIQDLVLPQVRELIETVEDIERVAGGDAERPSPR